MNTSLARTALPTLLSGCPLLAPSLAAWLLGACLLGCSGTETDNPIVQTPDYRSPIRFEPAPPEVPACPPPTEDGPPRLPLWGRSGNYLVGIDTVGSVPRRGLVVLDVSEPAAPQVVAEQPLAGYPRQLLVEEGSATLVIDELPQLAALPVAGPAALAAQTKLVRFDLSTPSAPERVAELALDDEFWQLQARGDSYWVLSGQLDPATQRCDVAPNPCGYVSRDAMSLTRHTWAGTGWVAGQRVELPAGPRVWLTEAGFATATSSAGTAGQLSFAVFGSDGSLGAVQALPLPEGIVQGSPLYLDGQRVGVFSYDLSDGSAAFTLHSLEGAALGRVGGLSQGLGAGTFFSTSGVLVAAGSGGGPGVYIALGAASALSPVSLPEASAFLPLAEGGAPATRALGWRPAAGSTAATFTLWDLEASPPALLDTLPATLAVPQSSGELQVTGDSVVFSLRGPDNAPLVGNLRWDADVLSVAGPIAGGYAEQVLAVGGWLYTPDFSGLVFGNPGQGEVQRQPWDEGELLDVVAVPGGEARLALDHPGRVLQLLVSTGSGTQSIAVGPGARRLLPAGDRLIVLSTERESECEQTGLDCSGYAPGIALVELASLAIAAELPLPQLPVPALGSQSRVEQIVMEPVRLSEQTWLLESEWSGTCLTQDDCAALGIVPVPFGQANVATGQQSCAPGVSACPQPPAPSVYGEARRRVFHVLDAAAARVSAPLVVEGARGAPFELWSSPLPAQGTVLDLHLEPSSFPPPGSPPPTSSAFFLERYVPSAAGGLEALPVLNVPGYPVALLGSSELLTLEPGPDLTGTAQLHRLQLDGGGATLLASRALEARAGEVEVLGQTAVYVRRPADSCEPTSHVDTFALDAQLTPRGSLELPGDGWRVLGAAGDSLVLQREHAFARIAIDAQGNASVAGFATAPGALGNVRLDGGVVRAISANRVLRLEP